METRSHRERFLANLAEVRQELREQLLKFSDEELEWSPAPQHGMKTVRDILAEVGTMEAMCTAILVHGREEDWEAIERQFHEPKSVQEMIELLDAKRAETIQYLESDPHADLMTRIQLPESWEQYFGTLWLEPEELINWILRHEYYHMGQLIIYLWQTGRSPLADKAQ